MRRDAISNPIFCVFILFFYFCNYVYPLIQMDVNKRHFYLELQSVCAEGGDNNKSSNKVDYIDDIASIVYYF